MNFKLLLSKGANMSLRINDQAPNFTADTTQGKINFHEWIGDGWAVLFSHPKNFTPVCTTELGYMASIQSEFSARNTKIIAISIDPVEDHLAWSKDVEDVGGSSVDYPIIADTDLNVAKLYSMFPADENEKAEGRTAMTNATVRSVFIVGPDKTLKLQLTYPASTGRNFSEILRVIDSLQLTANHSVATPANWVQGGKVVISPQLSTEEAKEKFPNGWEEKKPYLRITDQPE
jgi:alkyl hydroperoxide reductase subunit AhpC